uniref:Uncharacterized protein n=1 Tax=Saccharolobus islandicus TaxID=43080 RepID=Q9P9K0_SACIS|nr:hypothetical protein [Sulfolobus islandicus]CAB81814.1 hypothetical protein [Sulfolobus islandicus]
MVKKNDIEELRRENEELKRKLEAIINNEKPPDYETQQEIENPYTVTNRAISELVDPKDTMFYLTGNELRLILTAFEIARLPVYFNEEPVVELGEFAHRLKHYLVSKGGRGRRDVVRVLKVSSDHVKENVNKSLFRQLISSVKENDLDEKED